MSARVRTSAGVLALGIVLAGIAAAVTASSTFVHSGVTVAVVVVSVFLPFAVAAELRARYPGRVLAALLIAVGVAYFVRSLAAIDSSVTYAPARAIGQFSEVLLVWLMLAFPSGRLPRPWGRAIVIAGALSLVLLWWPTIAYSPQIPAGSLFVPCGGDCPANSLLVAHQPATGEVLEGLFRGFAAAILVRYRSRSGRPPESGEQRDAACARAGADRVDPAHGGGCRLPGLGAVPSRPPGAARHLLSRRADAGIIIGLVRGRAYDAAALERLVRGLRARPGPAQLRDVMAQALQDPTLQIAYWLHGGRLLSRAQMASRYRSRMTHARAVTRVAGPDGAPRCCADA